MDNSDNYPVLIHCYHGTGRAEMYSALYRIEYEVY
jgi:protein tyrosine/serine phosphatase